MSALRKTMESVSTPKSDMHTGFGAELYSAGFTHCLDGLQTQMFSSGTAPSTETAQFDGVLTDMFSSGT
ncbi:hypothetical protein [Planktotalea sp.]|uniref:hypothetical protein n=1 Tax=Planktotalea sp. TaxID=2029877 RepID=UPI0032993C81